MDIVAYICISLACLLAGAVAGCVGGLSLGWVLALGYRKQGPSDPGDAPLYVGMGLMPVGACVGAAIGLTIGIIYCIRFARRKALTQSS